MRSYCIRVRLERLGPNPETVIFVREKGGGVGHIHRGKKAMFQQRQILEWCSYQPRNGKDCQEQPETRRGQEGFFPKAFSGGMALPTL